MPIDALAIPGRAPRGDPAVRPGTARTIMVVNGNDDMIELIEAVLDAGRYDVVFVESTEHAYSRVKRVQPGLVVLCTRIEDISGFHVLSMLKLDEQTRNIPVLTYTSDYEGPEAAEAEAEEAADELLPVGPAPAGRMN